MKKLLVLSLVLGIASLATAGFSLATDLDVVTMSGADNPAEPVTMFLVFAGLDTAVPTSSFGGDPVVFNNAMGNAAGFEALLGLDAGSVMAAYMFEMKDTSEPFVAPNGDDIVTADVDGIGTVYLLTQQGATIDSVVVPEPATMALLGLGALVLRRKK